MNFFHLACLAALSSLPTVSIGQSSSDEGEFQREYYGKNFAGWNGIVFLCEFDDADTLLARICDRARTDLNLLAATHRISVEVAKPNAIQHAAFIAAADNRVTLTLYLDATKSKDDGAPKAVFARLAYETFFSDAVEKNSKQGSIYSLPRSGDLEIWSSSVIGSGIGSDLISPIADGVETLLKEALTLSLRFASPNTTTEQTQ